MNSFEKDGSHDLLRRLFLRGTGGGLLLRSKPELIGHAFVQDGTGGQMPEPPPSRPTGRLVPEMEKEMPVEPARRLGWAVVGLSKCAPNQILPSFGEGRSSKLVALVSRQRQKVEQVASRYGVDSRNLYDYATFGQLVDTRRWMSLTSFS